MLTERLTQHLTVESVRGGVLERLFLPLLRETLFGEKTKMEQMIRIPYKWVRRIFIKERNRFILGCNFSLYKDDLLKVNGFDERFVHPGYGEDIDLGNRLRNAGVKTISRKRMMVVYHVYHKHLATNYPDSIALLEANKKSSPYTKFGIVR